MTKDSIPLDNVAPAVRAIIRSTGGKAWDDPGAVLAMQLAYKAGRESFGDVAGLTEVPIGEDVRRAIQKAANFLDAAAGEGLELEGVGAADEIVMDLHSLLAEDSARAFHEDVNLWLFGKIRPTVLEQIDVEEDLSFTS